MKRVSVLMLFCLLFLLSQGQQKVFTSDIDNFWIAYDSIQTTKDSLKQIGFIQKLYIDKGTPGLKAFMIARGYSAKLWIELIHNYPKFWNSIRSNTFSVKSYAPEIEKSIQQFKELYPDLKDAKMYFTVGGLRSGGTTMNDMVLIGSEIATGNPSTDVSEFPSKWLEGVFKNQKADNIVALNIHEYVHTQQKGDPNTLLGQAIKEGACDFITELVIGRLMQNNYIVYGRTHEAALKEHFKFEMFSQNYINWLYNGSTATVGDLGYFMGYAICKSYYENSPDKKFAIKEIIELKYSDSTAVENFLSRSKYYTGSISKAEVLKEYDAKKPYVVRLEPFQNGDNLVDAGIKELKIVFSTPMYKKTYSINDGRKGKEYSPIVGVVGFSEDGISFTLKIELKPDHEYEFIITDLGFNSSEGYPLKPYEVKFKTR